MRGCLERWSAAWTRTGPAGWVGSGALEFYGTSLVQIPDPNFGRLRWEITTAAWVKVNAWPGDWSSIIGKWNTTWRFARRQNTNDFTLHLSGVEESLAGSSNINDGYWHHVAATYDGNRVTTYLDGQVNSFMDASGPINEDLDPTHIVMIGNRGDNTRRGAGTACSTTFGCTAMRSRPRM